MWKSIATNESTWIRFKAHLQEAYLDREEIEQTTGAVGYDSAKNVKHGEDSHWRTPSTPRTEISPSPTGNTKKNHHYHLFKNMNRSLNKIVVTAMGGQWIQGVEIYSYGVF